MAFAAIYARVPAVGWWLFAANLFWVIAYDTEYAMVDRDDDLKLGLKTSAITFGRYDVLLVMLCYAIYVAALAYIGHVRQMGAMFYVGVLIATLLACWHYWLIRNRDRRDCFRAFLGNHWVGLTIFAGVVADFGLRLNHWPR